MIIVPRTTLLALLTVLATLCAGSLAPSGVWAQTGSWSQINSPSGVAPSVMLQLSSGAVMVQNGQGKDWYKLTPGSTGSLATGTWTKLASANVTRLYYGSVVLRDGRVFCDGGEYSSAGSETPDVEIYDPLTDKWTSVGPPPGWAHVGDAPTVVLPNGDVLVGSIYDRRTALFDPVANSWSAGPSVLSTATSMTESTWQVMPTGGVSTVVCYGSINQGQNYDPVTNAWYASGATPNIVQSSSLEIGSAVLLPGGSAVFFGATGHNAIYTPGADASQPGSWTSAADFPTVSGSILTSKDTASCLMPNGRVLTAVGPVGQGSSYNGPISFVEYDPATNSFALAPTASNTGSNPPYNGRMLASATGDVLFSCFASSAAGGIQDYAPVGSPNAAWQPAITSLKRNPDNSYTITGTQLNGLSFGASYGDDATSGSNYPLARITNLSTGNVFYARTYNWSAAGVATGATPVTTRFQAPTGLGAGGLQLVVVANGIGSAPVSFKPSPRKGVISIASGAAAAIGIYKADAKFSGGAAAASNAGLVDMSKADDPAPMGVYQSERSGPAFTYAFSGLIATQPYTLRLHFTEDTFNAVGARKFNVTANGTSLLSAYDIFADAQAMHTAIVKSFKLTPDSSGSLQVVFTGVVGNAKVDAVQLELP